MGRIVQRIVWFSLAAAAVSIAILFFVIGRWNRSKQQELIYGGLDKLAPIDPRPSLDWKLEAAKVQIETDILNKRPIEAARDIVRMLEEARR